ncbi:MAG: aromatic acid exporter family protein [Aerococcus sp.]|nr:aromatic acid exporter family protein [Aerococcus sp.]
MKLGARTIKTGIGVVIAMLIGNLIPYMSTMQPAWIAIMGLQQTIQKSWRTLFSRAIAALTGGATAVIAYASFGNSPLVVGVTVIIFIMIMNAIRLQNVIGLASVTVIVIMLTPVDSISLLVQTAFWRVMENIVGVLIAFFVNLFIFPPHYDDHFYQQMHQTSSEILIRLRAILRKNGEYTSLNSDLNWANKQIVDMKNLLELAKEEIVWLPSKRIARERKLAVFRSFLDVLTEMVNLLYLIHTHTNTLFALDDKLRFQIRERIETLSAANEQIYLKFERKIPPQQVNFFVPTEQRRQSLMENLFKEAKIEGQPDNNKLKKSNALILIAGAIVNVEDELIHLNEIVRSYHTYHEEIND